MSAHESRSGEKCDTPGCDGVPRAICDAPTGTRVVGKVKIHRVCAKRLCCLCRKPQVRRDTGLCPSHEADRLLGIELRGFVQ
jgi:hypothetical protein